MSAASTAHKKQKVTTITIAYPAPVADHMLPAVTSAAGYFGKYHIRVKLVYLTQSLLLPAMVSGEVQFATLAAPGYEIADLNGQSLQAIALFADTYDNELVSISKFPTISSLNGQTLAISSAGSQSDLLAHILERKYNITVHEEPLGSTTTQEAALESGSVVAKPDLSPTQLGAVQNAIPGGVHVLLRWWQVLKNFPAISFVGYSPWMKEHRTLTVDVLKALNRGLVYFRSNEAGSVKTIAKVTGVTTEQATAGWLAAKRTLVPGNTLPSLRDEKQVFSYIKSEYPAAASFNPAKVINASYDRAAGA